MIPNFKTYVNESVWGEIRKKSLGQEEREETGIEHMSGWEFYEYIVKTYHFAFPPHHETPHYNDVGDIITLPMLYYPNKTYKEGNNVYNRVINVQIWDINKPEITCVCVPTSMMNENDELAKKLDREYWMNTNNHFWSKVNPRNKEKITKKFILGVMDFILDNPEPYNIVAVKK